MTSILKLTCLGLLLISLSSCAYVHTRSPYDDNLDNTELGSKLGKASNHCILWLVAWGDGSYAAAAQDGEIKVMKHADVEVVSVLFGAYVRRTVLVYGD
ncbi:MAG: hypothetical protein C0624_09745 [Desulfuromonas sp.]|nr:MAG: hypothetical protein C0624_09745 [Desulfuromonas sp.]